jgi:hypothetical protein
MISYERGACWPRKVKECRRLPGAFARSFRPGLVRQSRRGWFGSPEERFVCRLQDDDWSRDKRGSLEDATRFWQEMGWHKKPQP